MATEEVFDHAIVGAGMAGASVAYRLALAGAKVIVLERESQPGYHSTGRSAAMFIESYGTKQIRALTQASYDFYTSPPSGFANNPILIPRGTMYIAQPGQEEMLNSARAAYEAQGLNIETLTAKNAIERVPCLVPDHLAAAILDTAASDIDVHELHQGFLRGMKANGAELICDAPLVSGKNADGYWTLDTGSPGHSTVKARVVVNAAGAWADSVATLLGTRALGIQPMRRSAFLFDPPPQTDINAWPCVLAADESFYFKPDAGLLFGSPANADPVPPHDVVPEEVDIATGIYRIEQATSLRIPRPKRTWAGLRSFAPDHEFVIGWDQRVDHFFWLAGQGGYGIQTAAGASLLAANLIMDRPLPKGITRFGVSAAATDPARFRN